MDANIQSKIDDVTASLKRRIAVVGGTVSGPHLIGVGHDFTVSWDVRFHVRDNASPIFNHTVQQSFRLDVQELMLTVGPVKRFTTYWGEQIVRQLMDAADQLLPPAPPPPDNRPAEMTPDDFYAA